MVYITLPADWCAFGFVLTHCDQKNTKFGFQGSGGLPECTCNADPPTASPTEQQHYYGCNPATETMVPIEPEECPSNDELRLINAAGNCTTVPCGALCEGDGECYTELNHPGHVANTTVTENNCWGGFDVYRKVCRDTTADTTEAATTPEPNTTAPVTPAATCPRNCGAAERGGGTCRSTGRCLSCNEDRVLQSGRCYASISCKGRRIQSGSQAGSSCRCLNERCHWCNRAAAGDTCRVCRDGWYLLGGDCVASCPVQFASAGVGQFKRRCADPFTCQSGRIIVDPPVNYGCKCANEDNTAIADCHVCEHRAGEHGQHCTKCNGGKFLFENRCERDNCDGLGGMIEYSPGSYGRQCRAPFTCAGRVDEAGNDCKCARSVGRNDCLVRADRHDA